MELVCDTLPFELSWLELCGRGPCFSLSWPSQRVAIQLCQSLQVDVLKAELEEVGRRNQSLQTDLDQSRKKENELRSKSTGAEPDRYQTIKSLFISVKSENLCTQHNDLETTC